MKFLHLGDLHLGKSIGDFDLYRDQEYILKSLLELIRKEGVTGVLVAGDVYDKAIPSESATRLLDFFLNELAKMKVNVFMISGNHDSDDRLNFGSSLFETNQIYIASIYNGELVKKTVTDEFGEIDIYLLPFVKASKVRHFYPDEKIENYDDAVKTIIKHTEIDKDRRNIIVAHQFVAGKSEDPVLSGSESVGTQYVGLVEKIGYDCFDDFDYAALGHIHSPQRVGRDEVRYSGSPLKYSLSEVNNEKTVPIITFGEKGNIIIELVPLKPLREMRHIKGTMKDLLNKENIRNADDFIYVTLTDEDFVDDAMGIFQQVYPNTLKIDYDNSRTRDVNQVDISDITGGMSFEDIISNFYRLMYGCDISDEELKIMSEVAGEAGVLDEAN